MTQDFKLMTGLVACAARGDTITEEEYQGYLHTELDKLMLTATSQHCEMLLILALQDAFVRSGDTATSGNSIRIIKRQILVKSMQETHIGEIISKLKENGINPVLLKGRGLSELYALPESRNSCDTDLLISLQDEEKAYGIFRSLNYNVAPRNYFSHHATCTHFAAGIIELHTNMFFDLVENVVFSGVEISDYMRDEHLSVNIGGVECDILGVTDHLIFITLHMIQHFIREGTSIRQLCDILLYLKKYKQQIDMRRYRELLLRLGYTGIYDAVCSCGVRYFHFKAEELTKFTDCGDNLSESFMSDIEEGGWIGKNRGDDGTVFRYYGKLRSGGKADDYEKYLKTYQRQRVLRSIFPSIERMSARVPEANIWYLLPYAWVKWLFYGLKLRSSGKLSSDIPEQISMNETQRTRVILFERLGL